MRKLRVVFPLAALALGANSEDQGGTGVKASAQGDGATNKDTQPREKQ